jgi:hypothetical protein
MALTGQHTVTVPDHRTIAKGTLSDILSAVSLRNGIPEQDLAKQLRGRRSGRLRDADGND